MTQVKVAVFSTHPFELPFLEGANRKQGYDLQLFEVKLGVATTRLAEGFPIVSAFVNDSMDRPTLEQLAKGGTRCLALRSAGFNHVDLEAAAKLGITVLRVPAYSPHAVAEHTLALILALNRRIYKAYNRVREGNFSLEGLMGFDLAGTTAGVIGTGKIGAVVAKLLRAFGCRTLAYDLVPNSECQSAGVEYVGLEQLLNASDLISLHCPLTKDTRHLINEKSLGMMKKGVMLINTSRGALVDTVSVIGSLKSGHLGYLGLDVYEEEGDIFFEDRSDRIVTDDVFSRLLTFPNVLITGHQGFFTSNALTKISETTLENIDAFAKGRKLENQVTFPLSPRTKAI